MAGGVIGVVDSRIFVETDVESCHNIVCFGLLKKVLPTGGTFFYIFFLQKCCALIFLCIFVKQTNKQTTQVMTKSINTRQYQFAHGKTPRGTGLWFFEDNNGDIFTVRDSYSSAVAAAKKALSGQIITVGS